MVNFCHFVDNYLASILSSVHSSNSPASTGNMARTYNDQYYPILSDCDCVSRRL